MQKPLSHTIIVIVSVLSIVAITDQQQHAWAHPFTEKTIPDLSSNAIVGTTEVIAFFSQPVDIEFSEIKVFDSNGNQIDNRDTKYHEDQQSLIVTTPPLQDGIYTASTKVLSKTDGHLVPGTFLFAVGNVVVDPSILDATGPPEELIYLPGAATKLPGLIGQTIVLGAIIASLAIWGTRNKDTIRDQIKSVTKVHHQKILFITGVGLILVLISNILTIAVQAIKLEASPYAVLGTDFGVIWIVRMVITVILLGMWFIMNKKNALSSKAHIPIIIASLALIATTTMVGHGTTVGGTAGFALDYIHNVVAAIWIGGIFYFVFALLPAISKLADEQKERMSLTMIPRFSIMFVVSVGVVMITGPMLMWLIESDVGLITESIFGQLIMLKIVLAGVMIGLGGYMQFSTQNRAVKDIQTKSIAIHKKLKKTLKADIILGFAILGIVAMLTNGTLPAGEIQKTEITQTIYGYKTTEFTENIMFEIDIFPFSSGTNTISIKTAGVGQNQLHDLDNIKVKISNPSKNIFPIEIPMDKIDDSEFQGEMTFGFSDKWLMEVTAQRTEQANESIILDLTVKPKLKDIQVEVIEYELPEKAKPLHPLYDGNTDTIWISDLSDPRIWQFSLKTQEFSAHEHNGSATTFLALDDSNSGTIWFTDGPGNNIGNINIATGEIKTIPIPNLAPIISKNIPITIEVDQNNNIWVVITNKNAIVKYTPETGIFKEIVLPENDSLPFGLAIDNTGTLWYSTTGTGKIGYIEPVTDQPVEIVTDKVLDSPEAMFFDEKGTLWIGEHTGTAITTFNPILKTFESITVPDQESLPFGMAQDRHDNIWFAQHVIDKIGVLDPDNGDILEVPIPTETSFIQFMTADGDGNIWFVEQEGNKIGTVKITEIPVTVTERDSTTNDTSLTYSEIASPIIAAGIIASALFYVKAVHDKRKINELVDNEHKITDAVD